MPSNTLSETAPPNAEKKFDWPLCYEAQRLVADYVDAFLRQNSFARTLAERMRVETGTEFFEWVDHLVLGSDQAAELRAAGFVEEKVEAPLGTTVLSHPRAMLPRVLVRDALEASSPAHSTTAGGTPALLAIRPEVLADFVAAHDLGEAIEGSCGARFRRARIHEENGTSLWAVERLGSRGFAGGQTER